MKILVVNAGSSSHKLSLYNLFGDEPLEPLWKGELDWGRAAAGCLLSASSAQGELYLQLSGKAIEEAFNLLLESMWKGSTQVIEGAGSVERIGHRVVHGGEEFKRPVLINDKIKEQICHLIPLAPLHNPAALKGIEWMERSFPSTPQIAVFDTAFHTTMPDWVKTYPIPLEWRKKGVQRYGFHGISHQYCAERAAKMVVRQPGELKIINCHLGNGCSLCAIEAGKSVDTTMGLTPLEGLMMGTRSGSIDPGILLYLMREHHLSANDVDEMLYNRSGLNGIGGSSDMRDLLSRRDEELPKLAIQMFIQRLKSGIGAMAASLGGFDVLSFTGGIGENANYIREEVCNGLACFGVAIDSKKNEHCIPDADISAQGSAKRVLVIHTQEEWMIAQSVFKNQINF